MNVKVSRSRRNGKLYQYAQLVESYRRKPDGMPTQRVIANLGRRTDAEIDALRLAFKALREGRPVVLADAVGTLPARPVHDNLTYLDVAVVLETWERIGLDTLLRSVLKDRERDVEDADAVFALVAHRCIEPDSKLRAVRWFAETALPELLGVRPGQFNNTRIHRVLDALEEAEDELQHRLANHIEARKQGFTALFMDVTDTWFVGRGPGLAEYGKTKEGLYRKKVNILLLCDEDGMPLRWQVLKGRRHDSGTMGGMARTLQAVPWAQQVPLLVDRAMGPTAQLEELLQTGLHFITALTRTEMAAYVGEDPFRLTAGIEGFGDEAARQAACAVEHAGWLRVCETLLVHDLGVIRREEEPSAQQLPPIEVGHDPCRSRFQAALAIHTALESKQARTRKEAGQPLGLSAQQTYQTLTLLGLANDLQQAVLDGQAANFTLQTLHRIARIPSHEEQREAFDLALLRAREAAGRRHGRGRPPGRRTPGPGAPRVPLPRQPIEVRAVLTFNPEQFVGQRAHADARIGRVRAWTRRFNEKLAQPGGARTPARIRETVRARLRKDKLLEVFTIEVRSTSRQGRTVPQLHLRLDADRWSRRRRLDGFQVIVAHPHLNATAEKLPLLYRSKDRVEKDFQSIKSVLGLRPVRHQTDPKVRAHVTLCMLALLIERTLELKLGEATSARQALRTLRSVHLNRLSISEDAPPGYTVTRTRAPQDRLLEALDLEHLTDDTRLAESITPR